MDFEQVLNDYGKLIWHIINGFIKTHNIPSSHADDIYQEACIRIYKKMETYDVSKSSMKTFIATNTEIVCMRYRREYFRHNTSEIDDIEKVADAPGFDAVTQIIDEYNAPKLHKKIIYQKLYGYTQKEIAQEFNLSQSTVSRILSEFRDYLIGQLKND